MGFDLFVLPIAGTLIVLGALAGLIAGAISEAGIGALVNGLMALAIPKDRALKYQARLQAGEFLVFVSVPRSNDHRFPPPFAQLVRGQPAVDRFPCESLVQYVCRQRAFGSGSWDDSGLQLLTALDLTAIDMKVAM